ncbi:GNAT family N-acetyltransferase [Auraticoccus sp. F435]|uniref:GNAT family N-acetyltransferase n=1 Tax=Auraticoccus cholistanensis TaxID=2656650 RepID=A0A6A9UYX5_9ACTN|nr:GNAT family protein [Auraticoccus cholistanensis]MVA76897.1 GNAT family N-acetyltransferase [Auraticoccus cholistanensis]
MTRLLADGVRLRLRTRGDAAALARAYVRNREHLAPWDPAREPSWFTEQAQRQDTLTRLRAAEAGDGLPLVLVSGTGAEEEVVGVVNVSGTIRGSFQSANLGYWVDAGLAGRGLMTEAVRATCELSRDHLRLHRLQAGTLLHNAASQRVLTRCGFTPIGVAERYLRIAGRWQDHRLFQRILTDED